MYPNSLFLSLGLIFIALFSVRAADDFECPETNGFFRDPKDPHTFYECVNNKPYTFHCPDELVFNEAEKKCDYSVGPTVVHTIPTIPTGTRERHGSTQPQSGTTATPNGPTGTPNGSTATPNGSTATPNGSTASTKAQTSKPTTEPPVTRVRHTQFY